MSFRPWNSAGEFLPQPESRRLTPNDDGFCARCDALGHDRTNCPDDPGHRSLRNGGPCPHPRGSARTSQAGLPHQPSLLDLLTRGSTSSLPSPNDPKAALIQELRAREPFADEATLSAVADQLLAAQRLRAAEGLRALLPGGPPTATPVPGAPAFGIHPGATSLYMAPAPVTPPAQPIEGFILHSEEIKQSNVAFHVSTLDITRTMFDALLTAAGRNTGALITHLDFNFRFPASATTVSVSVIVIVAPNATAAAPTSWTAATNGPATKFVRRNNDITPEQVVLPSATDLTTPLRLFLCYSVTGATTANPAGASVHGNLDVEVGALSH